MKEKFKKGEEVDWKDHYREDKLTTYGDGPFIVHKVIPVPSEYINDVGHNQWIVISKIIDSRQHFFYQDQWNLEEGLGKINEHRMSGLFFKNVS